MTPGAEKKDFFYALNFEYEFAGPAFGQTHFRDGVAPDHRLAKPGNLLPLQQQLFGVVNFKVGDIDVDFGLGYGLTSGSDRVVAKMILEYAFPVPGKSNSGDRSMKVPSAMGGALHTTTRPGIRACSRSLGGHMVNLLFRMSQRVNVSETAPAGAY